MMHCACTSNNHALEHATNIIFTSMDQLVILEVANHYYSCLFWYGKTRKHHMKILSHEKLTFKFIFRRSARLAQVLDHLKTSN